MHVKIDDIPEGQNGEGQTILRKGLVATQDFEEGDVIFVEEPIVSALNSQLEVKHAIQKRERERELKWNERF